MKAAVASPGEVSRVEGSGENPRGPEIRLSRYDHVWKRGQAGSPYVLQVIGQTMRAWRGCPCPHKWAWHPRGTHKPRCFWRWSNRLFLPRLSSSCHSGWGLTSCLKWLGVLQVIVIKLYSGALEPEEGDPFWSARKLNGAKNEKQQGKRPETLEAGTITFGAFHPLLYFPRLKSY